MISIVDSQSTASPIHKLSMQIADTCIGFNTDLSSPVQVDFITRLISELMAKYKK
jgi:hypothetical protein